MSADDIPRHFRLALVHATRAFDADDLARLGTINEDLQGLVDAAIAHRNRHAAKEYERGRRAVATLNADTPWPLYDTLTRLVDAADHLHGAHSCDTHGWENARAAADSGRAILASMATMFAGWASTTLAVYPAVRPPCPECGDQDQHDPRHHTDGTCFGCESSEAER